MNKIELNSKYELSYPVGENMFKAINYINEVIILIKQNNLFETVKNITLWGRGSSGAILSTLFTAQLIQMGITVRIVHVKKEGESSHGDSYNIIEEESIIDSYNIIIDDFIEFGGTVNAIYDIFQKYNPTSCIHMLIVQSINTVDNLNFTPKCVISHKKSLKRFK